MVQASDAHAGRPRAGIPNWQTILHRFISASYPRVGLTPAFSRPPSAHRPRRIYQTDDVGCWSQTKQWCQCRKYSQRFGPREPAQVVGKGTAMSILNPPEAL